MRKTLLLCLALTAIISSVYGVNLYKGFEKKEIALGLRTYPNFGDGQYFYAGYAISKRTELSSGFLNKSSYNNRYTIDAEISYHFFPCKKYDLYFGIGPSYQRRREYHVYYTEDSDTIRFSTLHNFYGGVASLGMNYWIFRNGSIGLELSPHLLADLGSINNNFTMIAFGRPFLGCKLVF